MELTQQQIDVLSQNLRRKRLRIELLDFNMLVVDTIEGQVINGSISADANNDIRRSGNITLAIPNYPDQIELLDKLDGFTIQAGGKIWLDKYIKIFVGIDNNNDTNYNTVWYNMGVFLINKPVRNFSGSDFSISFECIDLMAKLTGQRQGQLTGQTTIIEKGYNETDADGNTVYIKNKLSDALVSVITELGGFSKYAISTIPDNYKYLPYDIKVGVGSTVYDILKKLLDIISTWQMYFDLDGTFIVEPIPSGVGNITYNLEEEQYISDQMSSDFENVKNQVVVYGRNNTLTYYTENTDTETDNVQYVKDATTNTSTLILKYSAITTDALTIGGTTFGFMSLSSPNQYPITKVEIWNGDEKLIYTHDNIEISLVKFENSLNSFGIQYGSSQVEAETLLPNNIYFIRIFDVANKDASGNPIVDENNHININQSMIFEFMGKQSVGYTLVNDNTESPFYINQNIQGEDYYAGFAETPIGQIWGSLYELTLNNTEALTELNNGTIITFMANGENAWLNNTATYIKVYNSYNLSHTAITANNVPIVQNTWDTSTTPATRPYLAKNKIAADYTVWMVRYEKDANGERFVFLGRNPSAITKIFSGGEYDNIYADQLAYERCLWELFNASNLNDNINLSVVPNYIIDVNCRIAYDQNNPLPKNVKEDLGKDIKYYITKQITYPLGISNTPQTISAVRIYDSGNLVGEE